MASDHLTGSPNDDSNIQTEQEKEEQFLLQETLRMREKLKSSRIIKKFDKLLTDWLNVQNLDCMNDSFCKALKTQNILKWKDFMVLNEENIRFLCNDLTDDQIIECLVKEWKISKREYDEKNQAKQRKKIKIKKEKVQKKVEKKEKISKFVCDKNVRQFLHDFGLNEVEHVFGKYKIDMTQLSELNNEWIEKHIVGDSEYANDLKMRLKLSINALRREIVREFKKRIKREMNEQNEQHKMKKKSNKCRKKLKKIHPILARVHDIFNDPLYLLSFGFVIFIIFTLFLFVVIDIETK